MGQEKSSSVKETAAADCPVFPGDFLEISEGDSHEAHFIALRKSPSSGEAAETAHLVAQAAVASKQEPKDLAEKYFQESINAFKEAEGLESAKCLGAVDDFCQFLIATGQQERVPIMLKGSLEAKISVFGYLSLETRPETYWLLKGTELAQGQTHLAYKKLKLGFFDQNILDQILVVLCILLNYVLQCLYLQTLLFGTHNQRTVATQEDIDLSK
ncbi:LOW QUALITY PROTEIN: tetratricopeptide repeat protein 23 [Pangshura tecta]